MPQLAALNDLNRRLLLAAGAVAFILLLMMAAGLQALSSHQGYSRFAALVTRTFDSLVHLEVELGQALAWESSAERADYISREYRGTLAMFSALNAANEAGQTGADPRWRALEAAFAIDPDAERNRLGIGGDLVPSELHALWHGIENGPPPLKQMAAEFFALTRPIAEANGLYTQEHASLLASARKFGETQLYPALTRAVHVLGSGSRQSMTNSLYLLTGCAAALILTALLSGVFIFRPLRRLIAHNSSVLTAERDQSRAFLRGRREFLAMMGHELRTAMNGIIGFSHLLLETDLEGKQKEYAQLIHESGQGLHALINDILDLSEVETGALRLEDANFSLPDMVSEVVTQFGAQAAIKGLEVGAFLDPALPERLRGDGGRIRQILVNLVSNAIKYTKAGGVSIEVRHEGGDDRTGHLLLVAVSDTGIGIAKDQLARIFERFTHADSTSPRSFEGSGLGLALCRELARLMGGQVSVESILGKGSTFSVRLRLASSRPAADRIGDGMGSTGFAGRRFLVVDDNAVSRQIFRQQLESYGAEVECVADAQAALATLAEGMKRGAPYDLAIIDQTLPETDGLILRKMIRDQPQYAALKLIISSPGGIGFDQQARALGFDAACPKPVLQDKLIGKLHELMTPPRATGGGADIAKLPAAKTPAPAPQPSHGKKTRLLVAEDNAVNQHLIATALRQAGIHVDIVGDGVEAVHAVQRQPYDLVLMDIRMPVMNGVEATQRIRALPAPTGKLPIIAMTANAMAGDREEYLAAGMDDYVAKPIDFNILMAKVRAHLPGGIAEDVEHAEPAANKQQKKSG